ncbi:MAG: hypothetical protein KatS3mg109_1968 [Pirellulaceae bacterium]|nr:MAG: hypothetical protein KatS3mg109_1968 [Pirellulaceae bacterium]
MLGRHRPVVRVIAVGVVGGTIGALSTIAVLTEMAAARHKEWSGKMGCRSRHFDYRFGLLTYADDRKILPQARFVGVEGFEYSWRVEVAPYFLETPLFDTSKPWTEQTNMLVVARDAFRFQCPVAHSKNPGSLETHVMVIVGPGALFSDDSPRRWEDVLDSRASTILCAEVYGTQVAWPVPGDLDISRMSFRINDTEQSRPAIRSLHRGGAIVTFADGSVRFLSDRADPLVVRAMATCVGNEWPFHEQFETLSGE